MNWIKMVCLIAVMSLMLVTTAAKAAIISYNGYTLDEDANIVTGNGVQWLQWDVTVGLSLDQAIADIADGYVNGVFYGTGWSVATNNNMAQLFNDFGFGASFLWDSVENTGQHTRNDDGNTESLATDPELQFASLFGTTRQRAGSNPYQASLAFYGIDEDVDNLFNSVIVLDDYDATYGKVVMYRDWVGSNQFSSTVGVALVRETVSRPIQGFAVSSPASLLLIILGLAALRRRLVA